MENTPTPLCPKCKKPMAPGRAKIEGYPYVPSYECWECLEVITKTIGTNGKK